MPIFLDIETTTWFDQPEIKAMPRDQQIKAMRFGCAVTCRTPSDGKYLYRVSGIVDSDSEPLGKSVVVEAANRAAAKLEAAIALGGYWTDDTDPEIIDADWREWTTDQITDLYNYLCWSKQQICGWNSLAFDWPVIINSAERAGVQLLEIEHETVHHADLFDFIRQKTGRWYSLETVAQAKVGLGKLADGQKAAEWLRSGDPDLVTKALEYCRYDVQLTMDLAAILKRGEPLRLPPRAQRQELNEVLIWNDGRTERIPDASGAVSTR